MEKLLLLTLMVIPTILPLTNAEHIEISTGVPLTVSAQSKNSKTPESLLENNFFKTVENYLTESTNVKRPGHSKQAEDYITGPMYPVYPGYSPVGSNDASVTPNADQNQASNYFAVIVPLLKVALQAGLQIFVKLFSYLVEGAGVLAIGGIITTVFCYLTSFCTVKYNGFGAQKDLSKDMMRAFKTTDKFASAAALVQEAIGKYQKLQKTN